LLKSVFNNAFPHSPRLEARATVDSMVNSAIVT
jgi:hypothetical protein